MSNVKITFPRPGAPRPPGRILVAVGRADESIVGVVGTCTPKKGQGRPIHGDRLSFSRRVGKDGKVFYRWMIGFQLDPSEYRLKVVGHSESGPAGHDAIDLEPSTAAQPRVRETGISISYPLAGDHTEEFCDGIPAFGDLDVADLDVDGVGLFDDSNDITIHPMDIGSVNPPYWAVMFPPITEPQGGEIPPVTYRLHVVDTDENQADEPGLTHTFECP